jgi:hypothetical protein
MACIGSLCIVITMLRWMIDAGMHLGLSIMWLEPFGQTSRNLCCFMFVFEGRGMSKMEVRFNDI